MTDDLLNRISSDPQARYREAIDNRVVSLWDMLQLQTGTFLPALTLLASAVGDLQRTRNLSDYGLFASATLPLETKAHLVRAIEIIRNVAEQHEMPTTLIGAKRCYEHCVEILAPQRPINAQSIDHLIRHLEQLVAVVIDEAEGRKFYTLGARPIFLIRASTMFLEPKWQMYFHRPFLISKRRCNVWHSSVGPPPSCT